MPAHARRCRRSTPGAAVRPHLQHQIHQGQEHVSFRLQAKRAQLWHVLKLKKVFGLREMTHTRREDFRLYPFSTGENYFHTWVP